MRARVDLRPRTVLPLALMLFLAAPAARAAAQEPVPTRTREHVVRRGDTLWDLARTYLMNPFLWPRIFEANRSVVEDPHWIYPNERLQIPGLTDTLAVPIAVTEQVVMAPPGEQERSRFYRPPAEPARDRQPGFIAAEQEEPWAVTPTENAAAPWLADTAALGVLGRVTRLVDPTRKDDRLPQRLHPYNRFYVGQLRAALPAVGDTLLVVGVRGSVDGWGQKVVPVGIVRVEEHADAAVVVAMLKQYGEAMAGDLVIPAPARPPMPRGRPTDVANGPTGRIIAFLDNDPLKGTLDQAFVDLGADQVRIGDVLVAMLPPEIAGGADLMAARIARLKVIRTDAGSSTVRVLGVVNTGLASGMPVRVTQRQP